MKRYKVETISENTEKYFLIRDYDTMDIVLLPTKYLKHKIMSNRSPNTVRRSAFAICYYLEYLNEIQMEIPQVYELDFETQNEHFVNFLYWLKAGNHTQKDNIKPIHNGTCNAYLEDVFRFFLYIEAQYEQLGDLKVLSYNYHIAANAVGVKKKLRYQSFKGYLKAEDRKVRPAEHEEIVTILQACTNCRDQLLLLLVAETGFRIGEILGVDYAHDIDYRNHLVGVYFREDNENDARAKNAEYRKARISDGTYEFLMYYLAEYRKLLQHQRYLFVNISGKTAGQPLKVDSVYDMLTRMEKKTGIDLTPHMLRRYFANMRRKDGCQDVCETAKRKLKQFLREERIQNIFEMDYPLRKAYEEYLQINEKIRQTDRYILAFDRTKQVHIRQQMKTLAGSFEYRWRLEDKVLFLPYHPDYAVAMEFDTVRYRPNMVWDFKRDCPMSLKEQIFRTLNSVIDVFKEPRRREFRLSGLQCLYDFCVEYGIKDIEAIDAKEETKFEQYLAEHTTSNSRKEMLLPIMNYCRKILFLQSDEINWNANVWYLERLHLPQNRINPSSSLVSISFAEIPYPVDRQCAKEYMKYQFGVTSRAVSTITIGYRGLRNMLVWFNEQEQSICDCTEEQMERYIKELQNQQIIAKTYNEYLVEIYHFLSFLTVRGYSKKVPFRLEYYQKKVIPKHHDRSVSPEVCMEMLEKLPLLPEHLRCMYLHLWCIGLRISEVCTLKGNAYYRQGEDTWIQVYQVKMKTYKRIPISDGLYKIMQVFIKRNGIGPDDYLFTNQYGGAYRTQTFRYQMKKFCSDNAVEGGEYLFQSHDYRHTVATFFYDSGVSLQSIRDYLGHDYEEMTEQYIDYMPRKIAAANTEFFGKPGNSLASCLKKGGKYGQ